MRWLDPAETPWPVPVLDVRPITLTMLSMTTDTRAATSAISYGQDDGLGFVGQDPPVERSTPLSLRYRVDPSEGRTALFLIASAGLRLSGGTRCAHHGGSGPIVPPSA